MKRKRFLFGLGILMIAWVISTQPRAEEDEDDEDGETAAKVQSEFVTDPLRIVTVPQQANWKQECGSCHLAFPPGLLPARSWSKMMASLDKHFGENASLDPTQTKVITDFLVKHSADQAETPRSAKIAMSIAASESPLRITETAYFKRKHHEIAPSVWKRSKIMSAANCTACHSKAEAGNFNEEGVRIPR